MTIAVRHEARDRFRISIRDHELVVDQPAPASDDSGPTPTELFVASIASCAAFYARRYLARHGLGDREVEVRAEMHWAPRHTHISAIDLELVTPEELDEETTITVVRAMEQCTVSASIRERPAITLSLAARVAREVAIAPGA